MLLVYAYHRLDYPSPYKTKHEKQGFKIVTLIPADTGKTRQTPTTPNIQMLSTLNVSIRADASSVTNGTVVGPVARILKSASSNAHASSYFTLVFSLCNLIFTA